MMECLDLKIEMCRRRIKQREVAAQIGISESRLSDLLTGFRPVDSEMKRRIREAVRTLAHKHDPTDATRLEEERSA